MIPLLHYPQQHRPVPSIRLVRDTQEHAGIFCFETDFPDLNGQHIHGGLSPRYRGSATLFWPCYFLEPNWLGLTIHQTTRVIDGGDVIHQTPADLVAGDGIQMHSARAVDKGLSEFVEILGTINRFGVPAGIKQRSAGKLFLSRDWRPEHLRLIYEVYGDKVVDAALQGEIDPPPVTGLTYFSNQK